MTAQRDNSGTLFRNDRKEKPSHADYIGNIAIDGTEYWLNGWKKQGAKGTFLSLAVKPKDEPRTKPAARGDFDDDIGF